MGTILSQCAKDYLTALSNPFDVNRQPCIPDTIAIPSRKFTTSLAFTMHAGTNGVASASVQGLSMISIDGVQPGTFTFNNVNSVGTLTPGVFYTGPLSTFPATGPYPWYDPAPPGAISVGVATLNPANAPFSQATLAPRNTLWRLVGCGLTVQATGKLVDRAGQITLIQFDPRETFTNTFTGDMALNRNDWYTGNVTDNPAGVAYYPKHPDDVDYKENLTQPIAIFPINGAGGALIQSSVGALVIGATPGTPYSCRAIAHFEYVGGNQPTSESHSDPQGMALATSAVTHTQQGSNLAAKAREAMRYVGEAAANFSVPLGRAVGAAGAQYVSARRGHPRALM